MLANIFIKKYRLLDFQHRLEKFDTTLCWFSSHIQRFAIFGIFGGFGCKSKSRFLFFSQSAQLWALSGENQRNFKSKHGNEFLSNCIRKMENIFQVNKFVASRNLRIRNFYRVTERSKEKSCICFTVFERKWKIE